MSCSPANEPQLIEVTDLIYSPSEFERRFLTGWWTRGLVPADIYVSTNWAGLIVPKSITFDNNEIVIEFPGRWWMGDNCRRSMPKIRIHIQYLCKGGRLYLHSDVWYGKERTQQTYSGHNGAQKFSRIYLEKIDEPCSLEKTANIPLEKADILELKHLADWLVTLLSVPGVTQIGEPNNDWVALFADYTETDLEWAPCDGCLFPTQNYSVPVIVSEDDMLGLELRLASQNVKALFDVLVINTIPETFNVPLCLNNTYLEVTLPELSGVVHMREFFNCGGPHFTDDYYSFPVQASDLVKCFQFPPKDDWPAKDDPLWKDICPANKTKTCSFNASYSTIKSSATYASYSFSGAKGATELCGGDNSVPGSIPGATNTTYTVVAISITTQRWNEITCAKEFGYSGTTNVIKCVEMEIVTEQLLFSKAVPHAEAFPLMSQLLQGNQGWTCNSTFKGPPEGQGPPVPELPPEEGPQGPNGEGNCFFEAELSYRIDLNTIVGRLFYELSIPIRAKLPKGQTNLGVINGSLNGQTLTISTQFGGSFTANLSSMANAFNAVGRTITSIIPVSFGLRNVRVLCP